MNQLKKDLQKLADPKRAKVYQRFFKTAKGEYGEGDMFLGVTVPIQRSVAKKYFGLSLQHIQSLLQSRIHEHRLVALFILVDQFTKGNKQLQKKIFALYMKNAKQINNWDLVDSSAPYITGEYLHNKPRQQLYQFARSKNLWKKRIAILSTFAFIKQNDFKDTFKIAEMLLNDDHDLIHKAVGWMLREVGNRDQNAEEQFLKKHYKRMPRTMLRYAIEKFEVKKRKKYLAGAVE